MPVYKDEVKADWNGVRKKKKKEGFKKQADAKAFERDFIKKQGGGSDMPMGALIDLYMEDCKSRLRATTYENKEYIVNLKIKPRFKDTPANEVTLAMIRKWQNELLSDKKGYSPTYLKTLNNQISAIFNFGVKYYGLPFNLVARVGSIGKKNADSMQFWTKDEFDTFIDFYTDKPRYNTIYNLFFYTGMRSGELLALSLNDFDFSDPKNYILRITKSYARVKEKDVIGPPKTPKSNET